MESSNGKRPPPFSKPLIAVGLDTALDGSKLDATDFHGSDGLGNVHEKAPHYTSKSEWMNLFMNQEKKKDSSEEKSTEELIFIPSLEPSYKLMLDILKNEPKDSVVIIAIGPLMNLAKAAELDPIAFSRVKEVVSMGGALNIPGNVTPFAEFNIFSDPLAAKRIFDMTSLHRYSSNDLIPDENSIKLTILPLDLTQRQKMLEKDFHYMLNKKKKIDTTFSIEGGKLDPLAQWTSIWLQETFNTFHKVSGYDLMSPEDQEKYPLCIHMHDPLAVWYAITQFAQNSGTVNEIHNDRAGLDWVVQRNLDIRIETLGEYTKGMTVIDSRERPKRDEQVLNDHNLWLLQGYGNQVNVVKEAPYNNEDGSFGRVVLEIIFNEQFDN